MQRFANKTALVTGGAGFIGSHIARELVREGARVRVIDNLLSSGNWRRVNDLGDAVERIEGSILDSRLDAAVAGVDMIFHLAALVSVPQSVADPVSYHEVDATGTLRVLESARAAGVKRLVYSSTSALYGDAPEQPKHESHRGTPISPYGVAKYAGELYVSAYASLFNMETVSLRYFNVFGPGQDPKSQYGAAIPNIVSRLIHGQSPIIYGDGEQTRDFCHVANIVHANLLAALAPVKGEAVNIGCGREVSVNEVVRVANELLGSSIEPCYEPTRAGDVKVSSADISAAERVIKYKPLLHFKDGMRNSIEWYKAQA